MYVCIYIYIYIYTHTYGLVVCRHLLSYQLVVVLVVVVVVVVVRDLLANIVYSLSAGCFLVEVKGPVVHHSLYIRISLSFIIISCFISYCCSSVILCVYYHHSVFSCLWRSGTRCCLSSVSISLVFRFVVEVTRTCVCVGGRV